VIALAVQIRICADHRVCSRPRRPLNATNNNCALIGWSMPCRIAARARSMLWIYTRNDSYFGPDLSKRWRTFRAAAAMSNIIVIDSEGTAIF